MIKQGEHTYGDIQISNKREDRSITIGKYCSIGKEVIAVTDGHYTINFSTYPFGYTDSTKKFNKVENRKIVGNIIIGNDVWIGDEVMLLYGCRIGDGAVIGAKSVVRGYVKPYSVVIGNPAQFLYYRFSKETIDLLLDMRWWDLPDSEVNQYSDVLFSNDVGKLKLLYEKIKKSL